MHQSLWREFWILAGIAAASVIAGAVTGHSFLVAAVGFRLPLAPHPRPPYPFDQKLPRHKQSETPHPARPWGDVFNEIRKLEKQAGRREDRLTGMITRFQNATAVMPDAVVIVSQHDEIEWSNPAAARLFGVRLPRDTGIRLSNLVRNPEFSRYLRTGEFSEPLEISSPVAHGITLVLRPLDL